MIYKCSICGFVYNEEKEEAPFSEFCTISGEISGHTNIAHAGDTIVPPGSI